ncbi:adhesion G-protein coupled receptor D1-like [Montipora capricornis]|uniref:adhesion G-protein coupled receptor D1-like n=1 Tax=Montipora capricornis TaxID=246305 RepID=UPI0035F15B85
MDLTNVDAKLSQTDRNLLEILTYVGLGLSILGSVITIISHWVLTERSLPLFQIRVSLMSSLLTGQITFLVGINATANKGACVAAAALMQYFFMAALCWMPVDGIHLYLFTVKVYNVSHKMLVYHLLSWGIPAVFVSISLGIATGKNGIESFVSDEHCWLSYGSGALWIFATFVALVELANTVIVVRVIKEMASMQHTSHKQMEQARLGIRACLMLMPLLGITWLFGLLTPVHTAFLYVNVILNSTQGFFIFALHCFPKMKRKTAVINNELLRLQIDIAGLQETRLPESGCLKESDYMVLVLHEALYNEYWSDLRSNIQQAADTGNINSTFEGLKKATGPKISKTAPIKSKAGTIITDKTKQLEKWVEHYSELYSRENIVQQSVLDVIDRLPQMPVLDEPPPLEELSKAIDKLPSGKAAGKDGIPAEVLRVASQVCWCPCTSS